MILNFLLAVTLVAAGDFVVETQAQSDYITSLPATVYEATTMSPQNMDFDAAENMFVAHSGWYNDALIHYYKFRIFEPGTYPDVIVPGATSSSVPMQNVYVVTTDGTLAGAVGTPIIEYHTADGVLYSDFMEIQYVTAPEGYTADMYKSVGDITASGATVTASGIICNLPVVPTDATLQDPILKGTNTAPILPTPVFYKGLTVWTYVFEVTDQAAADYFAPSRANTSPGDGYDITVTPFATANAVNAIPIWHLNQFSRGVTEGFNGGGPSPAGMRNVINLDRGDNGYSPLWQVFWGTALPINYVTDQASNNADMTSANGFDFFVTSMFVNCPDIGPVGSMNPDIAEGYTTEITAFQDGSLTLPYYWLLGSDSSVVLKPDVPVSFQSGGNEIGSTKTNMMGAYEYKLDATAIPAGTTVVDVVIDGTTVRSIPVATVSLGGDYLKETPSTPYESAEMSPLNMDFDKENNMFVAHPGWYNDKSVFYYKFMMYTPNVYPGVIAKGSTSSDVPMNSVYIATTTGDLLGAVGDPIIEYHTSDGVLYSDYMEINYIMVGDGYTANTFKSVGDLTSSGADVVPSGIILNLPVVPTGATLQDPRGDGTATAPISPTPVWYKGFAVWTYVFEVTEQEAADYFASTRTDSDPNFAITVVSFASPTSVRAIPIWHVNQYTNGVVPGTNNGGPSHEGMKNVINQDRGDEGYSPLWQVYWATQLPINYDADQASNFQQMSTFNGFEFFVTPMFVNCPDIGPVGTEENPDLAESYTTEIDTSLESNMILGSHMTTIMTRGTPVSFQTTDGTEIGATTTNMMGAFEYNLLSADIPAGTTMINVVSGGQPIWEIPVDGGATTAETSTEEKVEEEEEAEDGEPEGETEEGVSIDIDVIMQDVDDSAASSLIGVFSGSMVVCSFILLALL